MFCPHCGKENKDGSAFCGVCGKALTSSAPKTPAKKPKAPKKVKNSSPLITKEKMQKFGLGLVIVLLYLGVCALFVLFLRRGDTISVKTIFDSDVTGHITLKQLLGILVSGNRIFNPTALSVALGVGIYTLVYSLPVFAIFALIGIFSGKKRAAFNTLFLVFTTLSLAALIAVIPVATRFVNGFEQAVATSAGVVANDVEKITYIPVMIFAVIIIGVVIFSMIFAGIFNKRRAQK